MQVIKRDNTKQKISFDKIVTRLNNLITMEPQLLNVNAILIAQKVIAGVYDSISTTQLDELAADASIFMSTTHYDYATLASRIAISNLHKQTSPNYIDVVNALESMLDPFCLDVIRNNIDIIQAAFDYTLDYKYDFFGFKTLCKLYLLKANNVIVERPQHLLMRVAIGIHQADIKSALESYHLMSQHYFTHATPTLFNSCTKTPQLASCFLMTMIDDSVEGIYDTLKNTALISKYAGGVGISIHNIRPKGSKIKSNGGEAEGIVPMLRTFNATACHINQASKRKGSFAMYLETHHPDMSAFLDMKKQNGVEELRARDLFYALWVSDLFMQRVQANQSWSFFCPDECPGLDEVYGDVYKQLYESYEAQGKARKTIKAQDLWNQIITSQMETGTPYMLYKDTINAHNNQSNLGTIKSSNLCVSGDTLILTNEGEIPIQSVVDQLVSVWNGEKWSLTTVRKTGENQQLLEITFSNGSKIKCTPYHKFHTPYCIIQAIDLKVGDRLIDYVLHDGTVVTNLHVTNTIELEEREDTYCFNEPLRHMGVFNGVLTSQCSEICEYTSPEEISVCTLASIGLPAFVSNGEFNHQLLYDVCYHVTGNLNKVIDVNFYPVKEAKVSSLRHRPIGIGVQGLADVFIMLRYPYDSKEAKQLNQEILETIYFASARASCDLAKKLGPYDSFHGSPASKGLLTPDLWNHTPTNRWNFTQLREDIIIYGLRNSLLTALMPTASTSSILNNTECFEPLTSNIYSRRVMAGEFIILNKFLIKDLIQLGIWNEGMKNEMIKYHGSIQKIPSIPEDIKKLYRTVWELSMRDLIDMSRDRNPFVCQSQSFNAWLAHPNKAQVTSMHFYGWQKGLKTGMYYLRTNSSANAVQITVDKERVTEKEEEVVCNNEEGCLSCGA
jgi:ribonucleotide reductase alpha subunit